MECPPISEIGRAEFQSRALDFIRSEDGPQRLAAHIASRVPKQEGKRCVIDGIRHLSTFEGLCEHFGKEIGLLFIQTPPDVSYNLYRSREAHDELTFTYRDFLKIYDATVEEDIPSLGRRAQVYIYNAFGIDAFRRTLDGVAALLTPTTEGAGVTAHGIGPDRALGGTP
jgi:hypothetical protein